MTLDINKSSLFLDFELFGYEIIEKIIWDNFLNKKLHHALLFFGLQGIGKASFAKKLAKMIILQSSSNKESDLLKINSGSHPDLLIINKDTDKKSESKKEITVDNVKKIHDFINLTSAISKDRVIIIDSIGELNRHSSNAILKNLEEPNPNIFFFLINHYSSHIPATIKSRCQLIKIKPINFIQWQEAAASKLANINQNNLENLFAIASNSISMAIEIHLKNGLEIYSLLINNFASEDKLIKSLKLIEKLTTNNFPLNIFKELVSFYLNRLSKFICGVEPQNYINDEEKSAIEIFATKNNLEQVLKLEEQISKLFAENRKFNLDKKHLLTNVLNILNEKHQ